MYVKKELIRLCIVLDNMLEFSLLTDNEFAELDAKVAALRMKISANVRADVDASTKKYEAATAAIKSANKEIEKAQQEIQDVAKVIARIADAVDLAAKLAAAAV